MSERTSSGNAVDEFRLLTGDNHRVVVEFDQGTYFNKLIHPEGGCSTADRCGQCGRPFDCDDEEWKPCYDCPSDPKAASEECWVQGWFDNLDGADLLHGSVELVVEPIWEHDHCELHVVGAAMPEKEARDVK